MEKPTATTDIPAFEQICSPISSKGGADSYNYEGTPETRITAFSPEEHSARSAKFMTGANNVPVSDPQPNRFTVKPHIVFDGYQTHTKHDPFVTSTEQGVPKIGRKLSATATDFQPFSTRSDTLSIGSRDTFDDNRSQTLPNNPDLTGCNASTELGLSRCLFVTQNEYSRNVSELSVGTYLANLDEKGLVCHGTTALFSVPSGVFIRFTNVRDACMLAHRIPLDEKWKADFKSPVFFHEINTPTQPRPSPYEGQLSVLAVQQRPMGAIVDATKVETNLRQVFQQEGDVFAFKTEVTYRDGLKIIVEYSDINVAHDAIGKLQGVLVNGMKLEIGIHSTGQDTMGSDTPSSLATPAATPMRSSLDATAAAFDAMSLGQPTPSSMFATPGLHTPTPAGLHMGSNFGMYPMMYRNQIPPATPMMYEPMTPRTHGIMPQSPMPGAMAMMRPMYAPSPQMHSSFMTPRPMGSFNRPDARRTSAIRVNRAPFLNSAGHHNHVDTARIREGIDVRTTVMLRNIPNKVDQMMLKSIVDESSWGKYDFMYLRIDFANDCNVGYAFINFVDPLDIIDFVNARGNQRWNCFKSDKVAEISYATIQGKDCLVQKFRNSSVMLEAPHYRPKLFYTSNGPAPEVAGQEEPFPEPDNQSKMKRSCENAEHVGLFTPNAGQQFRDEQRRRRSQYDRGTRLAALEEYDLGSSPLQYMHMPLQ